MIIPTEVGCCICLLLLLLQLLPSHVHISCVQWRFNCCNSHDGCAHCILFFAGTDVFGETKEVLMVRAAGDAVAAACCRLLIGTAMVVPVATVAAVATAGAVELQLQLQYQHLF